MGHERCDCELHGHRCRRFNLWVAIYPAEGGEKVAGGAREFDCTRPSGEAARELIRQLAIENNLERGSYAATWRHCYGRENTHLTLFDVVWPPQPLEVSFS